LPQPATDTEGYSETSACIYQTTKSRFLEHRNFPENPPFWRCKPL